MKIRTMWLHAIISEAFLRLEIIRVVYLLFPAMRMPAEVVLGAPLTVGSYISVVTPFLTKLGCIAEKVGLSTIILPVVRINTKFGVVIILTIWAPNSLKMINIEIVIR